MANVEVLAKEVRIIRLFGKDIVVEDVQTKPPEVETKQEEVEFLSIKKTIEKKKSISKLLAGKKVKLFALPWSGAPNSPPIFSGSQPSMRLAKRRKITISRPREQPAIPPQLSSQAHAAFQTLGGNSLAYLANKTIEVSDVNDGQNRLFIPKDGVNSLLKSLTAQEKDVLQITGDKVGKTKKSDHEGRRTSKIEGKIEVTVIDGEGNSHVMNFKKWPSMGKLVLLHGWYQFAKAYGLKAGDSVQLWCFRGVIGSRLCFAIVKNEIKGDDARAGSSSGTSALSNA